MDLKNQDLQNKIRKIELRTKTGPFVRRRGYLMMVINTYKVFANLKAGTETIFNRRLAIQAARAAEHIEARDVLTTLLEIKKQEIKQIGEAPTGADVLGYCIALNAEAIFDQLFEEAKVLPENQAEQKSVYAFSVVFNPSNI